LKYGKKSKYKKEIYFPELAETLLTFITKFNDTIYHTKIGLI